MKLSVLFALVFASTTTAFQPSALPASRSTTALSAYVPDGFTPAQWKKYQEDDPLRSLVVTCWERGEEKKYSDDDELLVLGPLCFSLIHSRGLGGLVAASDRPNTSDGPPVFCTCRRKRSSGAASESENVDFAAPKRADERGKEKEEWKYAERSSTTKGGGGENEIFAGMDGK